MAVTRESRGHQCQFLDPVSEEFRCKDCGDVARDISIAVYCGQHYCKACISHYCETSKPCPGCGQDGFSTVPHVRYRKSILALRVSCLMKDRGCDWTGELHGLNVHLDNTSNNCQYVDVECPNHCHQVLQRHEVSAHLKNTCPKREYKCGYCGFVGSYDVVCNEHYSVCDSYPLTCPNSCTDVSIERGKLDVHLKTCPRQEVECNVMGCGERFTREAEETHMEENTQKHMSLMATATRKLCKDMEAMSKEKDEKIKQLEEQLCSKENQIESLEKGLKSAQDDLITLLLPVFRLSSYAELKTSNSTWQSRTFYTHFRGYKLRLLVWPNGEPGYSAHRNAVTVKLSFVDGEYDDSLRWPVKFSITVELINQHGEHSHYYRCRDYEWDRPNESSKLEWVSPNNAGAKASVFITHKELEWNPRYKTQYLKDDRLLFKTRVAVIKKT